MPPWLPWLPPRQIIKVYPTEFRSVWSVNANHLYKNCASFFPLGCYYMARNPTQKTERAADFNTMKNLGVNCVVTQIAGIGTTIDLQYLNMCAAAGIYVIVEFEQGWAYDTNYSPPAVPAEEAAIRQIVAGLKDHAAIMGFLIRDDVDDSGIPAAEISRRTAVVKGQAPDKITFASGFHTDAVWRNYIGTVDILSKYSYPGRSSTSSLADVPYVYYYVDGVQIHAVAINNVPTCLLMGTTGQDPNSDTPNYTDLATRNMFWNTMVCSCQGNIFYAYREGTKNLSNNIDEPNNHHIALRAEWTKLFTDAKVAFTHLARGTLFRIPSMTTPDRQAGVWIAAGLNPLLVVTNNNAGNWNFATNPLNCLILGGHNTLTKLESRYATAGISNGILNSGILPAYNGVGAWMVS